MRFLPLSRLLVHSPCLLKALLVLLHGPVNLPNVVEGEHSSLCANAAIGFRRLSAEKDGALRCAVLSYPFDNFGAMTPTLVRRNLKFFLLGLSALLLFSRSLEQQVSVPLKGLANLSNVIQVQHCSHRANSAIGFRRLSAEKDGALRCAVLTRSLENFSAMTPPLVRRDSDRCTLDFKARLLWLSDMRGPLLLFSKSTKLIGVCRKLSPLSLTCCRFKGEPLLVEPFDLGPCLLWPCGKAYNPAEKRLAGNLLYNDLLRLL